MICGNERRSQTTCRDFADASIEIWYACVTLCKFSVLVDTSLPGFRP